MADPAQQGQQLGLRIVAPTDLGDTPVLYANHIQATITPEDFTLHLGWYTFPIFNEPPSGAVEVPVKPLAKVVLPLNIVRGLVTLLESQMVAWETAFDRELPSHPHPPVQPKEAE